MTASHTPRARFGGERGHRAAVGRGIVCMLGGCLLLTVNDTIMKLLTEHYTIGQAIFGRGVLALVFLAGWVMLAGGASTLRVYDYRGVIGRGAILVCGTYMFITGLSLLPLSTAIAVSFTGPLVTALLAVPILRERIGPRRGLAILVGFCGVVVMVRPSGDVVQWAILLPLGATVTGAFRDLLTRHLAARESSLAILVYSTAIVSLGGLASLPFGWAPWRLEDLPALLGAGATLAGAHYLQIEAFRCAPASLVAPYRYSSLVWAGLFGFLVWHDLPDAAMLLGTALVVAAGLYLWRLGAR
ncbi:MAG: DMT family transporter [Alphaproteobacteria bacterium]